MAALSRSRRSVVLNAVALPQHGDNTEEVTMFSTSLFTNELPISTQADTTNTQAAHSEGNPHQDLPLEIPSAQIEITPTAHASQLCSVMECRDAFRMFCRSSCSSVPSGRPRNLVSVSRDTKTTPTDEVTHGVSRPVKEAWKNRPLWKTGCPRKEKRGRGNAAQIQMENRWPREERLIFRITRAPPPSVRILARTDVVTPCCQENLVQERKSGNPAAARQPSNSEGSNNSDAVKEVVGTDTGQPTPQQISEKS